MAEKLIKMRQGGVTIFAEPSRVDFFRQAGYEVVEEGTGPETVPSDADLAAVKPDEEEQPAPKRKVTHAK